MKSSVAVVLLILLLLPDAGAQTRLSGKVADFNSGAAIDYAVIAVAEQVSGKVTGGTTTDSAGLFLVSGLPEGHYTISVSFPGYITARRDSIWLISSQPLVILPDIRLQPDSRLLQGVTITGAAPVIEHKIDRIVYNTANDVTAQGGVALDVLKKVPQVSVDADGNVELQGNTNIRFLINGKPSGIFGSSLADALAGIPASQIKSIEAITSPGAQYDAQGTGGIINIILKDNKVKGVNGSVNLSAGTRMENTAVNLNRRSGCFGINVFFSGNAALQSKSPGLQDRTSYNAAGQTSTRLVQDGYSDVKRKGYQTGIGFDWNLSKAGILSGTFQYNSFSNSRDGITEQQSVITDAGGNFLSDSRSIRNSGSSMNTRSLDWSLGYKHQLKRKGESVALNYTASLGKPVLQYNQDQFYAGSIGPYAGTASHNTGKDNQYNLSVDYVRPVGSKVTIETGVKTSFYSMNSRSDVDILLPNSGDYYTDTLQSYSLHYKMNISAGYVAASFPLFGFLDVKAGFRAEHTAVSIDYGNTHIPSYSIYAPSVIFSHKISDSKSVKLAYSRRIERPDYEELNPFLNLSDPYNITTGNPMLQPEIGNIMELGYNHSLANGGSFYIALSERINTHDIKSYTVFYPAYTVGDSVYSNVSVTNRRNIGMEYNSGLIVTGSLPLLRGLNVRGNLMLLHRHILNNLDTVNPVSGGLSLRLNINFSYQVSNSLVAEAFGNYRSPFNTIQGRSPQLLGYTLAFRKQFWHKNAGIGITATNFLSNYIKQVTTIRTDGYTAYNAREIPLRSIGITFTYKFGRLDVDNERKKSGSFPDIPDN